MGDGDGKLGAEQLDVNDLPEAGDRFELIRLLGSGICSNVYAAVDKESGKNVAVKVQNLKEISINEKDINEEYRILRDLSSHPNMPTFYGAFTNQNRIELWFVMEVCEGGTVVDLVNGLLLQNKRMKEEHIGYILRELVKALCFLHENNVIHRNIRCSNILFTKNGEVKLVDFGSSRELESPEYKTNTGIGSPAWMAPEVVLTGYKEGSGEQSYYDKKIDVWSVGIAAIELGDGKPPYLDIHPTRALFQIVRNPPPGLSKPSNWSQLFNDFIAECLEKNPDHRPYMEELLEHPFITQVPDDMQAEIKTVMESIVDDVTSIRRPENRIIKNGYLKMNQKEAARPMHLEDLAALKEVSEDTVLGELQNRHLDGLSYTFVGDVLLYVNPNQNEPIYEKKYHYRYQLKCRSDNAPHIFSVADAAYQDMLHHEQPQHILLAGETKSGKSFNYGKLIEHLLFLGEQNQTKVNNIGMKIKCAIDVIQAFGNAATKYHMNSTRHVNQTQITYSSTGKISGAIFFIYQLEKWRVTNSRIGGQKNFHVFYDFVEAASADQVLSQYHLIEDHRYRYLVGDDMDERKQSGSNVKNFHKLLACMKDTLEFTDSQLNTIWRILAAILNAGELTVSAEEDGETKIDDNELITKIAELLEVDPKKLTWSLLNYCVVVNGVAVRRKHTVSGAYGCIRVFAQTLYSRLFDWIVNVINFKLSFTRAIFGDTHVVYLMDAFGFECFHQNNLDQLFINCLNEQFQYHYNQRMFAWEIQDLEEEGITYHGMQYRNNKPIIDVLMNNPDGLFYIFDDATKNYEESYHYITNALEKNPKEPYIHVPSSKSFSVAHYSGTVSYQLKDVLDKNRDFLAPEVVETMRMSKDNAIKDLFINRLTKSGNLTVCREKAMTIKTQNSKINRWGAALVAEKTPIRKYNTESRGEYSQTRRVRTASAVYRSSSMEILRSLADTADQKNGVHFVRCLRAALSDEPLDFQPDVVRQQLKALAVVETVSSRQNGYSCRISFHEFIQRYKFLAFDFYENVEVTKENCRLLLIRLKMEGWLIGKGKVFLRYYNEEYLSRLYETQVKKIVKVQSMLRTFITKRKIAPQLLKQQSGSKHQLEHSASQEEAALVLQKHYRGYQVRSKNNSANTDKFDAATHKLLKVYCKKWKAKSIFQVILLDRAKKLQDVVYFSQQVHMYNQHVLGNLNNINHQPVVLGNVMSTTSVNEFLGSKKCYMYKIPFQLNKMNVTTDENILLNENITSSIDDSNWDAPLNRLPESRTTFRILKHSFAVRDQGTQVDLNGSVRFSDTNYEYSQTANKDDFHSHPGYKQTNIKTYEEKQIKQPVLDNRYSVTERNDNTKTNRIAPKPKTIKPSEKPNPLHELQSKGKQYQSASANEDDPPYNFQGILKKTNYKRPSLEGRNCTYSSKSLDVREGGYTEYVGITSKIGQSDDRKQREMVMDNVKQSKDYKNELNQQLYKATKTELLPGVTLEGQSYDL